MTLAALTSAALVCSLAVAPAAAAQASKVVASKGAATKDAAPAVAAPPSPELVRARMRPPVKGTAYIEIIKGSPKRVGDELRNVTKVKNTSAAPIVGLRVDEYFYAGQKEASVGSGRIRTALAPGEVAEIMTAAEFKPGITATQLMFSHANGQVKPTAVKKFTEEKK
ncbi:MAG: hypothetical protein ABIQ52_08540 [Vicinamibacterales bacterium]